MEKIPHILLLASWYPSERFPLNGNFVREIAKVSSESYKITVLHIVNVTRKSDEKNITNQVSPNFEERICYVKKDKINPFYFIKRGIKYFKAIEKERGKVHFCHVQVVWKMGLLAYYLKKRFKIPYIITEHWTGYMPEDFQLKQKYMGILAPMVAKNANGFITVSKNLSEEIHKLKITTELPFVLPNIVNFTEKGRREGDKKIRFISVSNLREEQKNIIGILKTFRNAIEKIENIELYIIGGEKSELLDDLIVEYALNEHVIRIPFIKNQKEVLTEIAKSDCLISFSNFETFALTCAEAVCSGVPVIYTACGGPEEYLDSSMGIKVPKNDTEALTQAIIYFTENANQWDSENIRTIARLKFNNEKWKEDLKIIYRECKLLP